MNVKFNWKTVQDCYHVVDCKVYSQSITGELAKTSDKMIATFFFQRVNISHNKARQVIETAKMISGLTVTTER